MSSTPDHRANASAAGDAYQKCMQELEKPHPDFAKVQALATLSLVAALREVAGQIAELGHQIDLAAGR
jgi:hypothetical protein